MTEFRNWRERVTAASGTLPKLIVYTRKSTEEPSRQVRSHDEQFGQIERKFDVKVPEVWHWKDDRSGTSFDRPGFQDILSFCKENACRKKDPGMLLLYDPSRFGRKLDDEGQPDILGFLAAYSAFEDAGWQLHFVTVQRTGNLLADVMTIAVHAYAAALYSANLSKFATEGRVTQGARGYWTASRAPWGTVRIEERTGRVLGRGDEKARSGGGGVILGGDDDVLRYWYRAARMVIGGASLDKIGQTLFDEDVLGPRDGKLGHRSIRNLLTNRALIGRVVYMDREVDGRRAKTEVKANWEPLVDVALFNEVEKELATRRGEPRNRHRKKRELYPLKVTCAACGHDYTGGRLSHAQDCTRVYSHTKPHARMRPGERQRFEEKGCKVWTVDAHELEGKVRDLIAKERTTAEFEEDVRQLILERDNFRQTASEAVEFARSKLDDAQRQYDKLARTVVQVHGNDVDEEDSLVKQLVVSKAAVKRARNDLAEAERFAQSKESAWATLSNIITESRNLTAAWDKASPEERKILFDYWVYCVMIVAQPIPGKKRANRKTAIVTLRTAPHAPKYFELDGQPPARANANSNSLNTPSSNSTDALVRSASNASGEPILPSADAACARTSGSGSSSADVSDGTSSAEPMLPNTTDALRLSPLSLARFIGDPLNATENSDGDMASNSRASVRASLPAIAARAANAGSVSGRENLRVNGHTS